MLTNCRILFRTAFSANNRLAIYCLTKIATARLGKFSFRYWNSIFHGVENVLCKNLFLFISLARAAAALLGECLLCTEHQKTQLPKIMDFIQVIKTFCSNKSIASQLLIARYGFLITPELKILTEKFATSSSFHSQRF